MKNETKEWMIKELTKAKIARWEEDKKGVSTQGVWWVQAFHDAEEEVKQAERNYGSTTTNLSDWEKL